MAVDEPEAPALWIYDAQTLRVRQRWELEIRQMSVSGDARWLAYTVREDPRHVRMLDLLLARHVEPLEPMAADIVDLQLAKDAPALVVLDETGVLCVWNTTNWERQRCHRAVPEARHTRVTPDGTKVLLSTTQGVRLVSAATGSVLRRWPASPGSPIAVAPDGRAAFQRDAQLVLVDLGSGAEIAKLPTDELESRLDALTFSDDGRRIAALCEYSQVLLWEPRTAVEPRGTALAPYPIEGFDRLTRGPLGFSPDGSRLLAGKHVVEVESMSASVPPGSGLRQAPDYSEMLAFSADGTQLIAYGPPVDLRTGKRADAAAFEFPKPLIRSADGRFTLDVDEDGARLRDARQPDAVTSLWTKPPESAQRMTFVRFLPDGVTLLAVIEESREPVRVVLFDARTGEVAQEIEPVTGCGHVDLSPNAKLMALACRSGVYVWDLHSALPRQLVEGWLGNGLRFLDDARLVATASERRLVIDVSTGRTLLDTAVGHGLSDFNPYRFEHHSHRPGRHLEAVEHADGVQLWQGEREIALLKGALSEVRSTRGQVYATTDVAFGPGDLVALGATGVAELWSSKRRERVAVIDGPIVRSPAGHYDVLGDAPSELRCTYGPHVLPLASCEKRWKTPGLLAEIMCDATDVAVARPSAR